MDRINAQPIMKWPGGKRRVLPELRKYVPDNYTSYVEPFIGGGAFYFDLQPPQSFISDINAELINLYRVIRDDSDALIEELSNGKYLNELEVFLNIRSFDRDIEKYAALSDVEKAARTLYLNRTCFNGLYRVNLKNQFNAHFGHYENPRIVDKENIEAISELFTTHKTSIKHESYADALERVEGSGNFIYLDPPYIPLTETASFVSYAKDRFGLVQQEDVRDKALKLDKEGNYILISNSDTPLTRELYKDFVIVPINVKRSIGASSTTRIAVGEVLILGKSLAEELNVQTL